MGDENFAMKAFGGIKWFVTEQAAPQVMKAAEEAANAVVEQVVTEVNKVAEEAKNAVEDAANSVVDQVVSEVNKVAEEAKHAVEGAVSAAIEQVSPEAMKIVGDAANTIGSTVSAAIEQVSPEAMKLAGDTANAIGNATNGVIEQVKKTTEDATNAIANATNSAMEQMKISITEQQMMDVLNTLYVKSVNGIDKVSLPVEDLVNDYMGKNVNADEAAKALISNSVMKCGTSGFISGLGGAFTSLLTLPANLTSVMYVQLRMCCAIAKMGGYDIHSDQVQTLVYTCLTGSSAGNIVKQAGIEFGKKYGQAMVKKKISSATINKINKMVGFRLVTKFGKTGIINLGKLVPILSGVIGGGIDAMTTQVIGYNAYRMFIEGKSPATEQSGEEVLIEVKPVYEAELSDIDTITLNESIAKQEN